MTEAKFSSAIVKIGNSYAIRVPSNIIKEISATEGDMTVVKMVKINFDMTQDIEQYWLKKARECKELESFSDEKIRLLARLSYNEGKDMGVKLEGKQRAKFVNNINNIKVKFDDVELKKMNVIGTKAQKEYRDKVRKEFGDKIYEEFLFFRKIVDPKFK
jgi:antitoxin component of MazEF toxin-antitoxin module